MTDPKENPSLLDRRPLPDEIKDRLAAGNAPNAKLDPRHILPHKDQETKPETTGTERADGR